MGRPKRKLSPLKSDAKLRKLSAFGFTGDKSCVSDQSQNDVLNSENPSESESSVTMSKNDGINDTSRSSACNLKPVTKQKAALNRKFRVEWQMNRDWLKYDSEKKVMLCSVCIQAQLVNSFTTGCSSMKLENIVAHENPKGKKSGKTSLKHKKIRIIVHLYPLISVSFNNHNVIRPFS